MVIYAFSVNDSFLDEIIAFPDFNDKKLAAGGLYSTNFRSTHLYAVGGSAGMGNQIARMELGDEETWSQQGSWQTGGGLETKEQRPNRPAVSNQQ